MQMKKYNEVTYFTNNYRIERLVEYTNLVINWSNNVERDFLTTSETNKSLEYRNQISRMMPEIYEIILSSGVPHIIENTFQGRSTTIELVNNIFNFHRQQLSVQYLIDCLNQAIWVYENDRASSIIRTINPFFWIGKLIRFIVAIPFKFLVSSWIISVHSEESNLIVRILKSTGALIAWVILIIGWAISITKELGLLDTVKQYFWM